MTLDAFTQDLPSRWATQWVTKGGNATRPRPLPRLRNYSGPLMCDLEGRFGLKVVLQTVLCGIEGRTLPFKHRQSARTQAAAPGSATSVALNSWLPA